MADKIGYDLETNIRKDLYDAIASLAVMPSMRAMMTAGPALTEITQQVITVAIYL